MKRLIYSLTIIVLLLLTAVVGYAEPPGFIFQGGGGSTKVGTVTNAKWCVGDASGVVQCTEDAPAGAGDVTSVGDDCASGACTAFTIGGVKLGDTSPDSDGEFGFASNKFIMYGGALVPATDNAYALGNSTDSQRWSDIFLGDGAVINFNGGDVTLTHSENTLTLGGGTLALGTNSITMSGSLGVTGTRLTKGWFTDLEVTNAIAGSITGNAATVTTADAENDTTTWPMLARSDTGSLAPATDSSLSYNANTGALTASSFVGALSGNASTATALAANGANCSAGQLPLGVDASGAAEGCTANPSIGTINVTATNSLNLGTEGAAVGQVTFKNATSGTITLQPTTGALGAKTLSLPAVDGTVAYTGAQLGEVLQTLTPSAGATGYASIRLPHGAAPTDNIANGDCWTTTAGLFCHINGSTVGPMASSAGTGYATIQEEGGNLTQRTLLNFVGGGFTAADDGANTRTNVTLDADLNTIAGLTVAQGKVIIGSASPAWSVSDFTMAGGTNTFSITNGSASLDVAAGATVNIDTSLTVDTAAVTLKGKSGGSTITLPTALDLDETMTDANLCKYTASGTKISCDVAQTTFQASDAELTAIAGLTFADASIIQLTGAAAAAVLTSGGNNYMLGSTSDNSALEFKQPTGTGSPVLGTSPSFTTSILPASAGGANIGSATYEWDNLYLHDGAVIYGQADQSATLTSAAGKWTASALDVTAAFVANGAVTIGNNNADVATIQSTIVGSGRAVTIDADGTTSPSYATATDSLFVTSHIETAGNVYASSFVGGSGTDTQRRVSLTSNTSLDCATYPDSLYYVSDAFYWCESTAAKTPMKLQDAQTATGVKTFQGGAYFGDASNNNGVRFYDGSSNYWTVIAPTGMSTNPTFKLPSAQGASGTYLYDSDGAGTLAWGTPTATAHGSDTYVQFNDGGTALGSDADFTYNKTTARLKIGSDGTGGGLVLHNELGATDYTATIIPNAAQAADATITLPAATGTLAVLAANTFTGNQTAPAFVPNSAANAAGEIGYASNAFSWFANSEDMIATASANLWTFSSGTDATFAFTPAVSVTGLLTSVGGITTTKVNAAGGSANAIEISGTLGIMDGSDTYNGLVLTLTNADHTGSSNTVRGIGISSITGDAQATENAVEVGTGWDYGLFSLSPLYIGNGSGNYMTVGTTGNTSFAGTATLTPPVASNCATNHSGANALCVDSDDQIVYVGTGAGIQGVQPLDADLTTWAGITPGANVGTFLATPSMANLGSMLTDEAAGTITFLTTPSSANLATALTDETGAASGSPLAVFNVNPTLTGFTLAANADFGDYDITSVDKLEGVDSGVYIDMGADGILELASDTNLDINVGDEGLRLTKDTNKIIVNTGTDKGVTEVSFSALNLVTTGTISGAIPSVSDADGRSISAAEAYGYMHWATGAGTWNLPAAAAGMNLCIYSTTAAAIVINPDDSDVIVLDGVADTAGHQIANGTGTAGDFICFIAIDATNWHSMGKRGTWTAGS